MRSKASENGRVADVRRRTKETDVRVKLNLDGSGKSQISIGVPFLEHMLELFAKHGLFDLYAKCDGDLHIDDHHSVEDIAITLGQALAQALADKAGINRYGEAIVPMDEALCRAVIDLSGGSTWFTRCKRSGRRSVTFPWSSPNTFGDRLRKPRD
jgi:imidazoleglycerol-phosphate dehydratase